MDAFFQQSRRAFRILYELPDSSGIDSTEVPSFELARRNRVLGLWADAALPERWTRAVYGQILHDARLSDEAVRIVDALKDSVEGLRLVKGPALSVQAWPREGLRNFDDLDFRCEKSSLPALVAGLDRLGYQVKAADDAHRDNLWHFGWGLEFRNADGVMVEVNHRMFPPHFPWPERLTRLSSGCWAPLSIEQPGVCCPVPAMHLLLACAHAAWHGWERLGWIADIAGLLVRHPGILNDAQALAAPASFLGKALQCGCGTAQKIFGPLPVADSVGIERQISQAMDLLARKEPAVPVRLQRRIHRQLMRPDEFACYTLRRLCNPGDPDFRRWSFSGSQRVCYRVLRPLRGLLKIRP